jgi:hypothetical protein
MMELGYRGGGGDRRWNWINIEAVGGFDREGVVVREVFHEVKIRWEMGESIE